MCRKWMHTLNHQNRPKSRRGKYSLGYCFIILVAAYVTCVLSVNTLRYVSRHMKLSPFTIPLWIDMYTSSWKERLRRNLFPWVTKQLMYQSSECLVHHRLFNLFMPLCVGDTGGQGNSKGAFTTSSLSLTGIRKSKDGTVRNHVRSWNA